MAKQSGTKLAHVFYDEVPPDASAMVESLRAHGYTLATAIADLIDNSIAAGCSNIWIRLVWDGTKSWASVTDDGSGMSEEYLVNAMRLGSRNPLERRDSADLGRFGLGLKTASFSQARRLTVRSRTKAGDDSTRRWDLDYLARPDVQGWQLLRTADIETGDRIEELDMHRLESGTQVLLEILDRVVGKTADSTSESHFVKVVARVRAHLEMVFHRFLSDRPKQRLKIFINDVELVPWDPFVRDNKATQPVCDEAFPFDESSESFAGVRVKGFVLPHKDRFPEAEAHAHAAGPAGWNAQQGFYLYRNRRLIVAGGWLGLGPSPNGWRQEEHYKLARIRVDISNSTDQEWQIDVKKSTAHPPPVLTQWLAGHAKTVRERAKDVYSHRGGYGPRAAAGTSANAHPWLRRSLDGDVFRYRINRQDPVLMPLIKSFSENDKNNLETLLRIIEETVPIQRIWIDTAEKQDSVAQPFEGEAASKLEKFIKAAHATLLTSCGDSEVAWSHILNHPAFMGQDAKAIVSVLMEQETGE